MDKLREYIRSFNENDEETVKNYIDNEHAEEFIISNFPHLSCPDTDIERTFAFRAWTLRKHIRKTDDGFVFSEFLPTVGWSDDNNTINAALFHHLNEARWMKDSRYATDYLSYFLDEKGEAYKYFCPATTEMYNFAKVTGNDAYLKENLGKIEHNLKVYDDRHRLPNGLYRSFDDRDAMEVSISGRAPGEAAVNGIRPTLNSYMYGGFVTMAKLYREVGNEEKTEYYACRASDLKAKYIATCRDDGFYKAIHASDEVLARDDVSFADLASPVMKVKEEIGYIPFAYGLYEDGDEAAFADLFDDSVFHTPYGITTADKSSPRYLYEFNHECLWNGYVWPYATSQTVTAMIRVLEKQGEHGAVTNKGLYSLIHEYAASHLLRENGKVIPWIDEVISPIDGSWYSRDWLRDKGWLAPKGGYERGKDYNHSTFMDLVIRGLIGVREDTDTLTVEPRIKGIWQWFELSNLPYRGKTYRIVYDEDGSRFGKAGVTVTEE